MTRCGCTSVPATGVSWIDTATINASGAGTAGSPFAPNVIVDPDADNLLVANAAGLFVPGGRWVNYMPTWTSLAGPPAVGNGTLSGRFLDLGKLLIVNITLVVGSTTSFAGSLHNFSLPAGYTPGAAAAGAGLGMCQATDVSAGLVIQGQGSGTPVTPLFPSSADANDMNTMSATNPFTWASSDILILSGIFEIA